MLKRLLFGLLLVWPALAEVSTEQEVAMGRAAAQRIEAESGIDQSPDLNRRLQTIGQALARVSGRTDLQFQFKVLAGDDFNAMALPGGFVYATRPLMQGMSDGEIAFVLGHELAHVVQRHSIHQMENEQMRKVGWLAALLALSGGRIDRQSVQMAGIVDQMFGSRFSQEDESEADRLGTAMMVRAGYDPAYALVALRTLASKHSGRTSQLVNAAIGSHPLPQDRINDSYRYIPPLAFQVVAARPAPPPARPTARPLLERLRLALAQATGWTPDAALMATCRTQMEQKKFDNQGVLVTSPAGESDSALERRLLTQEVARRYLSGQATRFGLAVRPGAEGQRLVWLKVR